MPTNDATARPLLAAIEIMGSGRLGPTLTALVGLGATVLGGRALVRARRRSRSDSDVRRAASGALVLGVVAVLLGGLFLATADGGPGTGNGVVASAMALVLGPLAVVLGGVARARGHRVA